MSSYESGAGSTDPRGSEEPGSEAAQHLKQSAGIAGETLKRQAERFASIRENRAGVALADVGAAVREAARCLRERDDQTAASWTETVADRIETFAAELRQGDPKQLTRSLAGIARRQPELSMAAMFAAGLGIARFLKSTGEVRRRAEGRGDGTLGTDRASSGDGDWRSETSEWQPEPDGGAVDPTAADEEESW
jgi:hypothetical protein